MRSCYIEWAKAHGDGHGLQSSACGGEGDVVELCLALPRCRRRHDLELGLRRQCQHVAFAGASSTQYEMLQVHLQTIFPRSQRVPETGAARLCGHAQQMLEVVVLILSTRGSSRWTAAGWERLMLSSAASGTRAIHHEQQTQSLRS
jgi:hypothetical protein